MQVKATKRVVTIICLIVITISILPCSVFAEATRKIDTFEYLTVYGKRCMKYIIDQELDQKFLVGPSLVYPSFADGEIEVDTFAGHLTLGASDFMINEVSLPFYNAAFSEKSFEGAILQCIVAISALEYEDRSESIMEFQAKFDSSKPASALEAAGSVMEEMIDVMNDPDFLENNLEFTIAESGSALGKRMLIYSGNYDYYLAPYAKVGEEEETVVIYLEAVARQEVE
ncbi:MAG: hypothetical protein IJ188_06570 [Clostridia bacterium]|nr:hypothetical protein [Clostridia bacterium]